MQADELQRLLDSSPVHRSLHLQVTGIADDSVQLRAQPGPEHAGADGGSVLHGGVVATLLDTAATFALIAATGTDWNTVDIRVDFLRPAPAGLLVAGGSAVQVGKRLGRATAELLAAGSDRAVACAAGTFVRAAPEAGPTP